MDTVIPKSIYLTHIPKDHSKTKNRYIEEVPGDNMAGPVPF